MRLSFLDSIRSRYPPDSCLSLAWLSECPFTVLRSTSIYLFPSNRSQCNVVQEILSVLMCYALCQRGKNTIEYSQLEDNFQILENPQKALLPYAFDIKDALAEPETMI